MEQTEQDGSGHTHIDAAVGTAQPVGDPRDWRGHVLVCGLHGVGLRIVELLHSAGRPVVVVDDSPDDRSARLVRRWGVPHLADNARRQETLEAAGLAGAISVICVENDDLHTLEIALLVHELRPDVRVIVRQSNASVGRAVEGVTGHGTMLDAAALSAPSFVQAALQQHEHEFDLEGVVLTTAELTATQHGALRHLYGDLAPIAVVGDDGDVVACPGRDHRVLAGQRVTLMGTREELAAIGVKGMAPEAQPVHRIGGARFHGVTATQDKRKKPSAISSMFSLFAGIAAGADRALRGTVLAVLILVVIAAAVLTRGYVDTSGDDMDWLDALYFTIETLATVGYGDFSFANQPPYLRIFAILLMIVGAGLVTILFAQITDLLVSRRIAATFGLQRVNTMRDHVIVVGLGAVGMRVIEALAADGHESVVIERNPGNRYLGQARALGVPVVAADATLPATLRSVNLATARSVAVLTSDDLVNIETGLAIRDQLGPRWTSVPVVLRLFDRQLGRTIERSFGFQHVRSTSAIAAPWFVAAALGLEVLGAFNVDQQTFIVGRLAITPGSGLAGLALADLSAATRVVAIRRSGGEMEHPPRRDTRLGAGDDAYIVGPHEELMAIMARDRSTGALDVQGGG